MCRRELAKFREPGGLGRAVAEHGGVGSDLHFSVEDGTFLGVDHEDPQSSRLAGLR